MASQSIKSSHQESPCSFGNKNPRIPLTPKFPDKNPDANNSQTPPHRSQDKQTKSKNKQEAITLPTTKKNGSITKKQSIKDNQIRELILKMDFD